MWLFGFGDLEATRTQGLPGGGGGGEGSGDTIHGVLAESYRTESPEEKRGILGDYTGVLGESFREPEKK